METQVVPSEYEEKLVSHLVSYECLGGSVCSGPNAKIWAPRAPVTAAHSAHGESCVSNLNLGYSVCELSNNTKVA